MPVSKPNFLDLYYEYIGTGECPQCFHTWCGLFILSVALGRRCFCDMSVNRLYPNMYIIIVGPAGKQRKSTAIDHAELLIHLLEPKPNLISQKITPQALIKALCVFEPSIDGKIIVEKKAEGYVICDELKNFIDKTGYEAGLGPILTSFYDCKEEWTYETKGTGKERLNKLLLGLLGGSSYQFLREALPEAAIGSGITRRMIFVSTPEIMPPEPYPRMNKELLAPLMSHLRSVSMMEGEFTMERDVLRYYGDAYKKFRLSSPLYDDPSTDTYASCRFIHVFKVSMCLSAAEGFSRVITLKQFHKAEEMLSEQEARLPALIRTLTMGEHGELITWVEQLIKGGVRSRRELLRVVSTKMSAFDLDALLDTLDQSGVIQRIHDGGDTLLRPQINLK